MGQNNSEHERQSWAMPLDEVRGSGGHLMDAEHDDEYIQQDMHRQLSAMEL